MMNERSKLILSRLDRQRIKKCIAREVLEGTINEHEIKRLNYELENAEIMEPRNIPRDVVTMNSEVKISFVNYPEQVKLKIVYPEEASIKEGKISVFSPIANALLGRKAGDYISWIVPSGGTSFRIDEILYQPEASGHYNI